MHSMNPAILIYMYQELGAHSSYACKAAMAEADHMYMYASMIAFDAC